MAGKQLSSFLAHVGAGACWPMCMASPHGLFWGLGVALAPLHLLHVAQMELVGIDWCADITMIRVHCMESYKMASKHSLRSLLAHVGVHAGQTSQHGLFLEGGVGGVALALLHLIHAAQTDFVGIDWYAGMTVTHVH